MVVIGEAVKSNYELKFSTGAECKELREHYKVSLREMELNFGYPQQVFEEWENNEKAIYKDALQSTYYQTFLDQMTSSLEFATSEIFNQFPELKTNKTIQDILAKYEIYEILGEDVEEWSKEVLG